MECSLLFKIVLSISFFKIFYCMIIKLTLSFSRMGWQVDNRLPWSWTTHLQDSCRLTCSISPKVVLIKLRRILMWKGRKQGMVLGPASIQGSWWWRSPLFASATWTRGSIHIKSRGEIMWKVTSSTYLMALQLLRVMVLLQSFMRNSPSPVSLVPL